MEAILSGVSETAFFVSDERMFSVHLDNPEEQVSRSPQEKARFLRSDGRLLFLPEVTVDSALERLRLLSDEEDVLDLALMIFAPELSFALRQETAVVLEEMLESTPSLIPFLENILFSRPFPLEALGKKALDACSGVQCPHTMTLFCRVLDHQAEIHRVFEQWSRLPAELFQANGGQSAVGFMLMDRGLFKELALSLPKNRPGVVEFQVLDEFKNIANIRPIVSQWISPFKQTAPVRTMDKKPRPEAVISGPEDHFYFHNKTSGREVLDQVNRQKEAIIQLLREEKFPQASKFLQELLDFQADHGGSVFVAKTLCDLAKEAQAMGLQAWELDLTQRAVEANPEDAWAWAQRGDALARSCQWEESFNAFSQSIQWDSSYVQTKNYRAEILKQLNRLEESLAAYDETVKDHPEDVVARTGRAEVLKSLNRREESLAAYDGIVKDHPEDVVARNGRAGVLKVMNLLDESLLAYEEVLQHHPEDQYAKNGRGSVLLIRGQLDAALAQVDLPHTPRNKSEWAAHYLCGVIYLRKGNLEKAFDIFSEGIANAAPLDQDYFRSGLAAVQLQQNLPTEAEATLAPVTNPEVATASNILRIHVFSLLGKKNLALAAYQSLQKNFKIGLPGVCQALLSELHRCFIQKRPEHVKDDFFFQQEGQCLAWV